MLTCFSKSCWTFLKLIIYHNYQQSFALYSKRLSVVLLLKVAMRFLSFKLGTVKSCFFYYCTNCEEVSFDLWNMSIVCLRNESGLFVALTCFLCHQGCYLSFSWAATLLGQFFILKLAISKTLRPLLHRLTYLVLTHRRGKAKQNRQKSPPYAPRWWAKHKI